MALEWIPLDHGVWSFFMYVGFGLLKFCWGFLCLYSSKLLAFNFLFCCVFFFFWLWYRGYSGLIEWIWKSPLFDLLPEFEKDLYKISFVWVVNNKVKVKASRSCLNSLWPHELLVACLVLCPWNFKGKNTGVGSLSLFQGIFPIQGSDLGFLHCRQILYHLSHEEAHNKWQLFKMYFK